MRIRDLFSQQRPIISFEFFPPRTAKAKTQLASALEKLRPLSPSFVSVTYGAGGSTRDHTLQLVSSIRRDLGIETMAHLTCVGSTRDEITKVLKQLSAEGIENVLCLRGDPPKDQSTFEQTPGGFKYASELTAFVRGKLRHRLRSETLKTEGHSRLRIPYYSVVLRLIPLFQIRRASQSYQHQSSNHSRYHARHQRRSA